MTITHRLISSLVLLLTLSCVNTNEKPELLARRYCSSCHMFVEPSLLDKKTWESGVFPEMAFRTGLDMARLSNINESELYTVIRALPPHPVIPEEEWKLILQYYLEKAPDSLAIPVAENPAILTQFQTSSFTVPGKSNMITMVKFDSTRNTFFIGTRGSNLYRLSSSLTIEDSFLLASPPSDMIFRYPDDPLILCMGIMDPNDSPAGSIVRLPSSKESTLTVADSIKRPVNLQSTDVNNDGKEDLIVSAFGNFTGDLLVFENTRHDYRRHVVHHFPGTRKTVIRDLNGDGQKDILALVTQGDEHIALFTNRGKFRFSYRVLLKFPPVYGSSYFDLCDFNADGHMDILYTNGDNADFSPVLKSYHGVRIFLNDGKNAFTESWFYPMHGASMARAVDFDKDGDLDIAAISFFPDFKNHPEHSFVYLENTGGKFTPYYTPVAALGRWITMETADIDGDDDTDLLLGALNFPDGVPEDLRQTWIENKASLLVLKNNLR